MKEQQPFVSCIMPTYNRRKFVPHAIRYFLRQQYEKKELIIIDDGTDAVGDLIPDNPTIKYFRLDTKLTLGAKLNMACAYAKGDIIANWDDDDWYAERRLKYQVEELLRSATDVCGLNKLLYYDLELKNAYQYIYPSEERVWLLGSSLCYKKEFWATNKYADINVGMDALFVWCASADKVKAHTDHTIAVHTIHAENVSPKDTANAWWHPFPVDEIKELIGPDWPNFRDTFPIEIKKNGKDYSGVGTGIKQNLLKNIYLCLVHENEDCIVDLIRNLHFHDPKSSIILYNGSENSDLLKFNFPFGQFGAVVHPNPTPLKHGFLLQYALSSMEFALNNFVFDSLTIVDSDQLAIRPGYRQCISNFLASACNVGMLSSRPERLASANDDVYTSIQAFKEYHLWKPFLQNFPHGESKFLHWTFWPSTVFTKDAALDLVKLFKTNKQLQDIMQQTKIWATEEIILPTLTRLLGYEIALNPCSYNFVQYQKDYSPEDIYTAMNTPDAYWIHPVTRNYDDPIRRSIREKLNQYVNEAVETNQD